MSWALAGFVGATLAPTDAALSAQVVNDDRIPMRLRRALNVESGLNDGIVTPIVVFTLAVVATDLGLEDHGHDGVAGALLELALGVVVGLAVGLGSAVVIALGSRRRWVVDRRPAAGDAGRRPHQLRARGGPRRQRVHRGLRRRHRLRRRRAEGAATWGSSASSRS